MQENSVTFLSSRGSGLNLDLKLLENYLTKHGAEDNYAFRFFLKSERIENMVARQGVSRAKKQFCENAINVICADTSLGKDVKQLGEGGNRILLGSPYEYQFKNALLLEKKRSKGGWRTFTNYTHIIPGSPFSEKLIREGYQTDHAKILDGIALPLVWDLTQPESREQIRKEIEFYFPGMQGKKVLAIMVYGEEDNREGFAKNFDVKGLVEKLGEDWFVITNLEPILEAAYALGSKCKDSFGYVDRLFLAQKVLYFSDAMITNNGRFAACMAALKKPIYCVDYKENYFEQYMRECYPELYLTSSEKVLRCDFGTDNMSQAQQRFQQAFSYGEWKCPYEIVRNLVNGTN